MVCLGIVETNLVMPLLSYIIDFQIDFDHHEMEVFFEGLLIVLVNNYYIFYFWLV